MGRARKNVEPLVLVRDGALCFRRLSTHSWSDFLFNIFFHLRCIWGYNNPEVFVGIYDWKSHESFLSGRNNSIL